MQRILVYWGRHWVECREGGFPVMVRKARSLVIRSLFLVAMALVSPVVVLIRLLRPIVTIRFGQLESTMIGHFAMNTELYLCKRDAGMHPGRCLDIFYHSKPVCNDQLRKMWERTLFVTWLAKPLAVLNWLFPGWEKHMVELDTDRDTYGLMVHTEPHLYFTKDEEERGREVLHRLGMHDGAPWVCFHVRDSAYWNKIDPTRDWQQDHRNASVGNYMEAAEELARRGYFAVRIGVVVREELPEIRASKIIDVTGPRHNDFTDIYLAAKCKFFLASDSGPVEVSEAFRRPVAWANIRILLADATNPNDLFIPKHWRLVAEGRFLTLREILSLGMWECQMNSAFIKAGIELVENTPEEIRELAVEMDERLNGTWQDTEEDKELQERFWSLFKATGPHVIRPRIAAGFLRRHPEYVQ